MSRLSSIYYVIISGLFFFSNGYCETVAETQKLIVASSNNFPPLNFLDEGGELQGFGSDLSGAVFQVLDIDVDRLHSTQWTEVLGWLDSGRADLIHDTGYTSDRDITMDFTQSIIEMDEVIFVRKDQYDIQSIESLQDKRVACVNQHITHLYLQKFDWVNCHVVDTPIEGVHALLSGRVDAYVYPREIVLYHLQKLGLGNRVKIVGEPLRRLSWSMTVKQGNTELLEKLNEGIRQIKHSGEYDRIYKKWFGESLLVGYTSKEVLFISLIVMGLALLVAIVLGMVFHNRRLYKSKITLEKTLGDLESTQQELVTSETRLSSILNNSPAVVYAKDLEGNYIFINKQFEGLFDITNESIKGKNDHKLFPKEMADEFRKNDLAVLKVRQPIESEEIAPVNGELHTYISLKFCLFDKNDEPYAVCGISTDITKRKRVEAELEKANQVQKESTQQLRDLYQYLDNVREEEKASIARDIHDELGMSLTALTLDVGWLVQQVKGGDYPISFRDKLKEMAGLLENASSSSRNIMSDLHPSILGTLGLVEAIEWQVQEFEKRADITCHVQARKLAFRLKDTAAIALFRIFQESMTNIIKHASATRVQIILDHDDQWLTLRVEDDGIGLTEGWDTKVKSYGMRGMQERAYALGGGVQFENRTKGGMRLTLRVPLCSVAEMMHVVENV